VKTEALLLHGARTSDFWSLCEILGAKDRLIAGRKFEAANHYQCSGTELRRPGDKLLSLKFPLNLNGKREQQLQLAGN
jgi:hypothetical protein